MSPREGPKFVVCVDGSEASDIAYNRAISMVDGRQLILIHVIETPSSSILDPFHDKMDYLMNMKNRSTAKEIHEKYDKKCKEVKGLSYKILVLEGADPRETICKYVHDLLKVDLLIVGSRGYGKIEGVLLGSVSRYLLHYAGVPVMVAR